MTLISVYDNTIGSRRGVTFSLSRPLVRPPSSVFCRPVCRQFPRPFAGRRCRQRGFTLLELLLVMGILGMAAMLLGPGLATLDSPGFNAQAREATGLLNYARRMAIVQGTPASIEFLPVPVDSGDNAAGDPAQPLPDTVGRWVADNMELSYRDSAGQDWSVDNNIRITFYPEGGSTGGELIMQQENRILTITVDPFSGRVQVLNED